jgi:hypothetical protein
MSAPVALAIVDDMIRDSQPEPADLPARLAHVSTLLTTPVPVAAAMTAEASEALNQTHDAAEAAGGTETSPSGKSGPPGKSETAGKPKDPGAPDTPGNSDHGGKDRGSDKSEHSGKGRDSAGSKKQ